MEDRLEDMAQPPTRQQLLNDMGNEHQQDASFSRHRIVAVPVLQSEAAVLEHVEAFVFATPAQPCDRGNLADVEPVDGTAAQVSE